MDSKKGHSKLSQLFTRFSQKNMKSKVVNKEKFNQLSAMTGGYTIAADKNKAILKRMGLDIVNVDINNPYRILYQTDSLDPIDRTSLSKGLISSYDSALNAWLQSNTFTSQDAQDRQKRLSELNFMFANSPEYKNAIHQVADAAVQSAENGRLIEIYSAENPVITEEFYRMLDNIGFTGDRARTTVVALEEFGESIWELEINENGVVGFNVIPPINLKERLEFDPKRVVEDSQLSVSNLNTGLSGLLANSQKQPLIKKMISNYAKFGDETLAALSRPVLFGYLFNRVIYTNGSQMQNDVLPPWQVIHLRIDPTGDYAPYGNPLYLPHIPLFKQYTSLTSLHGMMVQQSLPRTHYKLTLNASEEELPPTKKLELVQTMKSTYENSGLFGDGGEVSSLGREFWSTSNLEMEIKTPDLNLEAISNQLQVISNKMNKASFGVLSLANGALGDSEASGESLVQQSLVGARHVARIQNVLLDAVHQLFRLHLAILGFEDYKKPFILKMREPIEAMSEEQRSAKSATISLTNEIFELLTTVSGLEDVSELPQSVIQKILSSMSFLDDTDILQWIDQINQAKLLKQIEDEEDEFGGGDEDMDFGSLGDEEEEELEERIIKKGHNLLLEIKRDNPYATKDKMKKILEGCNKLYQNIDFLEYEIVRSLTEKGTFIKKGNYRFLNCKDLNSLMDQKQKENIDLIYEYQALIKKEAKINLLEKKLIENPNLNRVLNNKKTELFLENQNNFSHNYQQLKEEVSKNFHNVYPSEFLEEQTKVKQEVDSLINETFDKSLANKDSSENKFLSSLLSNLAYSKELKEPKDINYLFQNKTKINNMQELINKNLRDIFYP